MKSLQQVSRCVLGPVAAAMVCMWLGPASTESFAGDYPVLQQRKQSSKELEPAARPTASTEKRPYAEKAAVSMPFYVFNNRVLPPVVNFALSGFMGDGEDLKVAGSYTDCLAEGYPTMKIQYAGQGKNGWAGAVWQNPANNWGTYDGGYNLGEARKLVFWARGDKGGEVVEFTAGGAAANYPDSDSIATGPILLGREWTEYIVDLTPFQLFYISTGFGLVVKHDQNPYGCVFYLDDIRYEK